MTFEIKLENPKDVKNLNTAALDYSGKLMVNCGASSFDARSILGLFALIGRKGITLVAPDHESPEKFAEVIKKIS
jgi:hypothetical protein